MTQASFSQTDRLDPRMRAILTRGPVLESLDIGEMRRHALTSKAEWNDAAKAVVSFDRTDLGSPLSVTVPGASAATLVHLHGGGWSIGSPETHLSLLAGLARETRRTVLAPRPRQAPEHPYPAPLDDVLDVLARREGPFALSGDSAGAHLALSGMLRARDRGMVLPVTCLVLFYGCYRRLFETESHRCYGEGYGLTTAKMARFWDSFAPQGGDYADLSNADFSGLPPVQLHVAECDPLASDTHWLLARLTDAGVRCELLEWTGMAHGFLHYDRDLPQARQACARAADFIGALS